MFKYGQTLASLTTNINFTINILTHSSHKYYSHSPDGSSIYRFFVWSSRVGSFQVI